MRVTNSFLYEQARTNVGRGQADAARLRQSIASGKRVNSFADDPRAAARILRERSALADVQAHRASAGQAEHLLGVTENALSGADDVFARVRELTTQFANDTYNAQDRRIGADEIVELRAQLVDLANTQTEGRYVFGGLGSGAPPFDAAGVFSGDTGQLDVPITGRTTIAATLPGGAPFVDPVSGASIFDTLDSIETALRADDGVALSGLVADVEVDHNRLTAGHQQVGNLFNRIDNIKAALDRTELSAQASLSSAQDTDLVTAIIDLQETESSLQAALAVTGRIDQLSLLNYM